MNNTFLNLNKGFTMLSAISCIAFLFLKVSCANGVKGKIIIEDAGQPFDTMMYLNKTHFRWGMRLETNTLDDTAKVGIIRIPPQKTGVLFQVDCFTDSIPFQFRPYKATRGRLEFTYCTLKY